MQLWKSGTAIGVPSRDCLKVALGGAQMDSDSTLLYIIGARPADVLPLGYSIFQGFVYISSAFILMLTVRSWFFLQA